MEIQIQHIKIAKAASRRFAYAMSRDDLWSCILVGAWQAIRTHDAKRGSLSLHIFNKVKLECLNHIRKHRSLERFHEVIQNPTDAEYIEESDSFKNVTLDEECPILYDKLVCKLSFKELRDKYKISNKQIRHSLKCGKKYILENFTF